MNVNNENTPGFGGTTSGGELRLEERATLHETIIAACSDMEEEYLEIEREFLNADKE